MTPTSVLSHIKEPKVYTHQQLKQELCRSVVHLPDVTEVSKPHVCVCDSELGPPGWREPLDCVRASELCNQNSQCSSRYRIMRQCLSGGDKERSAMLASKECQGALEVLQDSPLYDCRCKRGMKKELQCLQNYWSIHMGLTEEQLATIIIIIMIISQQLCDGLQLILL
ncbi:GDNF family receptor alpha-2 [Channa argus]|uniref:GDNF family receptor alpha-2 n=1 Tax=Channa argus TaxID=215402 RepID=A0A6G1QGR4_CHAAH|nr:GDNF family receptor alpha-2 [Channa argus]